jgi:hypothetical protein
MNQEPNDNAFSLGDILKKVARKEGLTKKHASKREQAQKIVNATLGELAAHALVVSVKTGVVTIEADSSAAFQEIEGFHKDDLLEAFRTAGMNIKEVRAKLAIT